MESPQGTVLEYFEGQIGTRKTSTFEVEQKFPRKFYNAAIRVVIASKMVSDRVPKGALHVYPKG